MPFTIIRRSKLKTLKEQARKDNKVIANLMSMNHQLVQAFNRVPLKYKKGLIAKGKRAKD